VTTDSELVVDGVTTTRTPRQPHNRTSVVLVVVRVVSGAVDYDN